jgi:transaldolase
MLKLRRYLLHYIMEKMIIDAFIWDNTARYANIQGDGSPLGKPGAALRKTLDREAAPSRILAASFRTPAQVAEALAAGAHSVTVVEEALKDAFGLGILQTAVEDFRRDWAAVQGDVAITEL